MNRATIHSRRARFGRLTLSLTVVLIAALVLLNVIFFSLAKYYSWYIDMTPDKVYSVSELCHSLLSDTIKDAQKDGQTVRAEIIFCEDYRQYATGSAGGYILNTAGELAQRYPDVFEVSWFDCWLDASRARELGVTNSTNVVIRTQNGQTRVLRQQEFFTFEGSNTSAPVGYDGERVFATTLSSLLREDRPLACLTVNHDERFYDQTLIYLLRDAGYTVSLIDLYDEPLPTDCALLVVYNPSLDFIVADGVSERSEIDKLRAHMNGGGDMMVFLSSATPTLQNLEAFLAEYGVSVARARDDDTDRSYNLMVKDTSAALTADGFTVLASYADGSAASDVLAPLSDRSFVPHVVFRDATVLSVPEGFTPDEPGAYTAGSRTRTDLFLASENAVAWSGGREMGGVQRPMALMSLTEDSATGAALLVCASTEFAAQSYLGSAVFGNADALLCAVRRMGLEDVLIGLRYKPFANTAIASITTAQATRWTVGLTLVPSLCVLLVATVVLVRRKHS